MMLQDCMSVAPLNWPTPNAIWPTKGHAEGATLLNAFDNALLAAGIGNLNLMKLSSIVPANVTVLDARPTTFEHGALLPCVFSRVESDVPGEMLAAGIGIALRDEGGVMFEYHAKGLHVDPYEDVCNTLETMIEDGCTHRGWGIGDYRVKIVTSSHTVKIYGCALAAVPLWWV